MPFLLNDGTIQFDSLDELQTSVESALSTSGLLLKSERDWPLRTPIDFNIKVTGRDFQASLRAEVVYCQGGKVGLDLPDKLSTKGALNALIEHLSAPEAEQAIFQKKESGRLDAPVKKASREVAVAAAPSRTPVAEIVPAGPVELSTPILMEDGSVRYRSFDAYIADYEHHLDKGLMYPDSSGSWKRGDKLKLSILVEGVGAGTPVQAEVLVCDHGKVGLDISHDPAAKKALAELLDRVKRADANPPAAYNAVPPGEKVTAAHAPVAAQQTSVDICGRIVPGAVITKMYPLTPVDLTSNRLDNVDLLCLIASLSSAGVPLQLVVELKNRHLRFGFNANGNIVHYVSSGAQEDLLERLVKRQLIPHSRIRALLSESSDEKPVEIVLMAEKVIKLHELWICVRDQVVDALEEIRHAGKSNYSITTLQTSRRTGVTFGHLIMPWLEHALAELNSKQLDDFLAPLANRYPLPNKDCRWPLSSLALDRKSLRFAEELLDGTRTLADALNVVSFVRRKKLRLQMAALHFLGTFDLLTDSLAAPEQKPEYKLSKELDELAEANRFDQAGVHWSAHPATYKEALEKIKREYGPGSALASHSIECTNMCRKRVTMAEKAVEYLENRERRKQYRKQVIDASQLQTSAEMLFKQIDLLLFRSDNLGAKRTLEMAVELNPKPEYIQKLQQLG